MRIKLIILLIFCIFISSCAYHIGEVSTNNNLIQDIVYDDIAVGEATTNYFLTFGGLDIDALVFKAKNNLYISHPLKPNQSYVNFTVDFKRSNYLLFSKTKVIVTADIIRLRTDSTESTFSNLYKRKAGFSNKTIASLFQIGDSVIIKLDDISYRKGVIQNLDFTNQSISISYFDPDGKIKTVKKTPKNVFSLTKGKTFKLENSDKKLTLKAGDKCSFRSQYFQKNNADILGVGERSLLVSKPLLVVEYKYITEKKE